MLNDQAGIEREGEVVETATAFDVVSACMTTALQRQDTGCFSKGAVERPPTPSNRAGSPLSQAPGAQDEGAAAPTRSVDRLRLTRGAAPRL